MCYMFTASVIHKVYTDGQRGRQHTWKGVGRMSSLTVQPDGLQMLGQVTAKHALLQDPALLELAARRPRHEEHAEERNHFPSPAED